VNVGIDGRGMASLSLDNPSLWHLMASSAWTSAVTRGRWWSGKIGAAVDCRQTEPETFDWLMGGGYNGVEAIPLPNL